MITIHIWIFFCIFYIMVKIVRMCASIILSLVFIFVCTYMYTTDKMYVFSYANENVIYQGNVNSKKVSLMFNVYWGEEYLDDILSVLNKYGVNTTFFIGGSWALKNSETLLNIYMAGHEIANHGYLHRSHDKLDYDANKDEITSTHEIVKSYIGIDMNLFAPPSGEFNDSTLNVCTELGYSVIMWTRDTIDWRDQDSQVIYDRAIRNVSGGDLILMHPTAMTLKALPMIITYLQANNFLITTVSDNISA